jgi:hypothetical protein
VIIFKILSGYYACVARHEALMVLHKCLLVGELDIRVDGKVKGKGKVVPVLN